MSRAISRRIFASDSRAQAPLGQVGSRRAVGPWLLTAVAAGLLLLAASHGRPVPRDQEVD